MSATQEQVKVEWEKADKDKSGTLEFKEVVALLKKLNLKLKDKVVKEKFKEVDKDGNKTLDFEEFNEFLERLRVRPEIDEVFHKFADSKTGTMSAEQFVKFLQTIQKESTADVAFAKRIIAEFEHKIHAKDSDPTHLSCIGFSKYMTSLNHNYIFNPKNAVVHQDMTQPFAHYWVASSHNTYLLGDQLKGESSVEAYINAFNKGCRCVELDCWDNDQDITKPIIYHGHTLTTKIPFRDVVECVRDHGFKVSPYPVILSLEVHCSVEGQKAMAAILKEVLGDKGFLPEQCQSAGNLPPPEKLKNKVLLKGKMVSAKKEGEPVEEEEEDSEDEEEEEEEVKKSSNKKELTKKDSKRDTLKDSKKGDLKESKKEEAPKKEEKKEKKKKEKKHVEHTAQELSDLIHLKTVKFPGFTEYKTKNKAWEMSSFSEGKISKFLSKTATEYVEYNRYQISRIYPKGSRVNSSNYDPVPSWNCGAQIVALNYQTGTEPMWTNDGKFQDNGGCGYILKPKYMREEKITFNPELKAKATKTFDITVLSAWQLPKVVGKEGTDKGEVIDPYVKISVNGLPADRAHFKTKVIKNNGFNPVWKAEYKIPLTNVDLALITFIVSDSDFASSDDLIGYYSLPAYCIRDGYRHVPLRDKNGKLYDNASLLIHTKIH